MDKLLPSEEGTPAREEKSDFRIPCLRYIVVFLATCVSAITLAGSFSFNYAVVCRVNSSVNAESVYLGNPRNSEVMYFDNFMTNMLYSSYPFGVFCGLVVTQVWKGYQKIPVRTAIFVCTLMSSLLTVLIPPLYDIDTRTTLLLKVLQGACVAPIVPLAGPITSHWAPKSEIGMFISVLTAYSQIGLFFLMSTSGILCNGFGWRSIFVFQGGFGVLVAILWVIFYRDTPSIHPWISSKEFEKIGSHEVSNVQQTIPYKKFFSSMSVWACLVACVGNYNGVSPFIVFASQIMKKSLSLSDIRTAQFNSSSFALQLIFKIISGAWSDRWKASEGIKLRFFNSISCGLCGVLICVTAFIPVNYPWVCGAMMVIFQGIIGFNAAGFNKAAIIIAGPYSQKLFTYYGMILTFSTLAEPFLVGAVAPNSTWAEWFPLFILHGAILILSNAFFCVFIRGRPASFTLHKDTPLL